MKPCAAAYKVLNSRQINRTDWEYFYFEIQQEISEICFGKISYFVKILIKVRHPQQHHCHSYDRFRTTCSRSKIDLISWERKSHVKENCKDSSNFNASRPFFLTHLKNTEKTRKNTEISRKLSMCYIPCHGILYAIYARKTLRKMLAYGIRALWLALEVWSLHNLSRDVKKVTWHHRDKLFWSHRFFWTDFNSRSDT